MPSFLTVRIYFKIPGKIYYQQYNEIITGVFLERFTITTVRGNRVMHKILKCSPLIMKNHVLNWCQWWVKLSLLDLSKLFVFFRWPASWRIETQPSESKGFLILHDHFSLRLDTKGQTIKKSEWGRTKKNRYKNNSREKMHTTGTTKELLCLGCSSWDESLEPRWKSFRSVKCVLLILGY